jgi:hypothetical protein
MTVFYSICAILGCTILVCQSALTVFGFVGGPDLDDGGDAPTEAGADGDVDHDHLGDHHGSSWFFGIITMRTVTAALAFFGLTGLAVTAGGGEGGSTLVAALAAGAAAVFFVHWMMKSLAQLRAEGTVRIERALGTVGSVYIKIPARRTGQGKVMLELQGRTVELSAVTEHDELPTGAAIVVTKVIGPDAVEVAPSADAA